MLSLVFCWPFFAHPMANGLGDWDQHTFYYASVLRSAAAGQRRRNPWYAEATSSGGTPGIAGQSHDLLALVMPLALAMKINVVAHYVVGCLGMHLLLRRVIGVTSPIVVVALVGDGILGWHRAASRGGPQQLSLRAVAAGAGLLLLSCRGRQPARRGDRRRNHRVRRSERSAAPGSARRGAAGERRRALVTVRSLKPLAVAVLIVAAGCAFAAPKLIPAAAFARGSAFEDRRPVKHPDHMR